MYVIRWKDDLDFWSRYPSGLESWNRAINNVVFFASEAEAKSYVKKLSYDWPDKTLIEFIHPLNIAKYR